MRKPGTAAIQPPEVQAEQHAKDYVDHKHSEESRDQIREHQPKDGLADHKDQRPADNP
jgi:hypothetical protein